MPAAKPDQVLPAGSEAQQLSPPALAAKLERHLIRATFLAWAGFAVHTVQLALRWMDAGHGPYYRRYEVYSSDAWVALLIFLFLVTENRRLRFLGVVVLPATFLLLGGAIMSSPEIRTLPPSFRTFWLVIHILFAKLAYGANLLGAGVSGFYLWKERRSRPLPDDAGLQFPLRQESPSLTADQGSRREAPGSGHSQGNGGPARDWKRSAGDPAVMNGLPALVRLDDLAYSLTTFGFINLTVMIVAGSIWARTAWGSYWSWDAVETWSLVSWLVYGLYLHLRRTYGWRGSKAAWFALAALGFLLFALFGVGVFYRTNHAPYLG